MIDRLARRLDLQPEELRHALTLGVVLFGITSSYTLVKTARDSVYLAELPAETLPYVYLGVGLLSLVSAQIFARVTRRWPAWMTLAGTAAGSAAALAVFAPFFGEQRDWLPVAFYLWVNVYGLLLVSQFWAFTAGTADPRLARRIFGLIGTGGILGGLVGGIVASQIGRSASLGELVMAAAGLVGAIVPLVILGVRHGHTPVKEAAATSEPPPQPWRYPYVRWLAMATLCSVIVTGLLDFQLKVEVQDRYPTRNALAHFFGWFYTAVNVGALTVQFLATRWSLQSLGATWSALVLPAGLGVGAVATIASPGAGTVMVTRLWDQIIRLSLNKSANEIFYFPLEPALRRHTKAVVEAGLERMGDGLAAILILAAGMMVGADIDVLAWMVLGIVVLWLLVWLKLRSSYARELGRNLRRLHVDEDQAAMSLRERALLKQSVRLLESPYERVVMHGMDLLEQSAPRLLENRLAKLIEHPSPRVRTRALALIAARQTEEARDQVRRLLNDRDPSVRLEALRAHLALGDGRVSEAVKAYLQSTDSGLRATAFQALVQFASEDEEPFVRGVLEEHLHSGSAADRLQAVIALGLRQPPSALHDLIGPLLEDPELEVRNAALRSAGKSMRVEYVPALIAALAARETDKAARDGLLEMGERVAGTLGDLMIDPSTPLEIRRQIPKVLGAIPTLESVEALLRTRDRDDPQLQYRVLKACNSIRAANPQIAFPPERVREDLEFEIQNFLLTTLLHGSFRAAGGDPAERFLCRVLHERLDQALNRIFRRLALIYPPKTMYAAYRGLRSGRAADVGNSLEYLENILEVEDRVRVLSLVDDTQGEERQRLALESYGGTGPDDLGTLKIALESGDWWLKACALHVVGRRRERSLAGLVETNREAEDPRVRETAEWARQALAEV